MKHSEKQAEMVAISEAFSSGKCNACKYISECANNRGFVFPKNTWCQVRKENIMRIWGNF